MLDHPDYFRYKYWFINENYETVSDVVGRLIEKGYATEFHISKDVPGKTLFSQLNPKDFVIEETYFFSENSEAGQDVLILAVSSQKHKVKGILVNGFAADTSKEFTGYWMGFKGFLRNLFSIKS